MINKKVSLSSHLSASPCPENKKNSVWLVVTFVTVHFDSLLRSFKLLQSQRFSYGRSDCVQLEVKSFLLYYVIWEILLQPIMKWKHHYTYCSFNSEIKIILEKSEQEMKRSNVNGDYSATIMRKKYIYEMILSFNNK